jgi:hypothetical protein
VLSNIPKKCPDCGNSTVSLDVFNKSFIEDCNWKNMSVYHHIVDESRSTVGYSVVCLKCSYGVDADE